MQPLGARFGKLDFCSSSHLYCRGKTLGKQALTLTTGVMSIIFFASVFLSFSFSFSVQLITNSSEKLPLLWHTKIINNAFILPVHVGYFSKAGNLNLSFLF